MQAQRAILFVIASLCIVQAYPSPLAAASNDAYWSEDDASLAVEGGVTAICLKGTNVCLAGFFTDLEGDGTHIVVGRVGIGWSSVGNGVTEHSVSGVSPVAFAIVAQNEDIYVGGSFSKIGNIEARNIARWNGSKWGPLGDGVEGIVRALTVANGKLYAGGTFSKAGDVLVANIAAWDGTSWSAVGQGIPGEAVDSLAANETTLYAGGRFWQGASVQATNIAQWDGARWKPLGKGIRVTEDFSEGAVVRALWLSGTNLYAGGGFRLAGDVGATNVARWDGSQWFSIGGGNCRGWRSVFVGQCRRSSIRGRRLFRQWTSHRGVEWD